MFNRKRQTIAFAIGMLALAAAVLPITLRAAAASADSIPPAARFRGVPEVGALYANAHAAQHGCTASVVHSPRGNTLITAAHCVVGSGRGMVFAPGMDGTRAPYGRWTVNGAYLEPAWLRRQDPQADVAFLTVAPRTIRGVRREIEQVTGAYRLGLTPARGQHVKITGYPAGSGNDPITCSAKVYFTDGFASFDCHGFVGGTSGSPWVQATRHGGRIVGVIGGLHQGGCYEYTSYSSPLGDDATGTYGSRTTIRGMLRRPPAATAAEPISPL